MSCISRGNDIFVIHYVELDHILATDVDSQETLEGQQEIGEEGDEIHELEIKATEDMVIEVNEQPKQVTGKFKENYAIFYYFQHLIKDDREDFDESIEINISPKTVKKINRNSGGLMTAAKDMTKSLSDILSCITNSPVPPTSAPTPPPRQGLRSPPPPTPPLPPPPAEDTDPHLSLLSPPPPPPPPPPAEVTSVTLTDTKLKDGELLEDSCFRQGAPLSFSGDF